jgi:anti-sigma regulatory factor (Ser/Thr protein kinase)
MLYSNWFGFLASTLLGLSVMTCGLVLLGGWRQYQRMQVHADGGASIAVTQPLFGLGRMPFVSSVLDVAAELRDVLARLATEVAGRRVKLEFAVQPDLSVHADPLALRVVLSELVASAMRYAPGGHVLVSAAQLGGRVQIAVMDDGAGPEAAVRQAALREVAELVALQGGTIDVETHPGEGTTVVVRLLEPAATGRAPGDAPMRQPAQQADGPQPAVREAVAEHSWEI